jgi:hypothetical protein
MVYAMRSKALILLILCFCINITVADRWQAHLHRRDGSTTPSRTATDMSSSSNIPTSSSKDNGGDKETDSKSQPAKTSASMTSVTSSKSSSTSTRSVEVETAVPSNINGGPPITPIDNNSSFNCKAHAQQSISRLTTFNSHPHPQSTSYHSRDHSWICRWWCPFDG